MTTPAPLGPLRRMLAGWSVRAGLVLIAAIAIVLGWIENRVAPRRAVRTAVERAGGFLVYDWQYRRDASGNVDYSGAPSTPQWLIDRLGPEYFGGLAVVYASNLEDGGALATQLGRLGGVRELSLTNVRIGDAGLAPISKLSRLTGLSLAHSDIGDAGLAHLSGLAHLETLSLVGTRVGDVGLAHLKELQDLGWLSLMGTKVGDAGLARLTGLASLRRLDLGHTDVTDAGLVHLEHLPNLFMLSLDHTRVTDAGLDGLARLPRLRYLQLAGVARVTPAGLEKFRKARPDVTVEWSPPPAVLVGPPEDAGPMKIEVFTGPEGLGVIEGSSIIHE